MSPISFPARLGFGLACIIGFVQVATAKPQTNKVNHLDELKAAIVANKYPKLTGLLVSKDGRLISEAYFGEGGAEKLNDTRSVTKSLTALVVGRAIRDGKIANVDVPIQSFFPDLQPTTNREPIKSNVLLKDLLTMSSALAADDSDGSSPGNEDRMHEQTNWLRWAIDLPIRVDYQRIGSGYGPFHYATVNAFLAGQVIQRAVQKPVSAYIAETLFKPLGITQYKFGKSPSGEIMTGGGLELRLLDLWRLGQLVLDEGRYQNQQIIPASWVKDCLTVHLKDTVGPGIGYGNLFWHFDFPAGEKTESGWFMAGNGGNVVLILPALKAVVVITRTDYNAPSTAKETIGIVSKFILPFLQNLNSPH